MPWGTFSTQALRLMTNQSQVIFSSVKTSPRPSRQVIRVWSTFSGKRSRSHVYQQREAENLLRRPQELMSFSSHYGECNGPPDRETAAFAFTTQIFFPQLVSETKRLEELLWTQSEISHPFCHFRHSSDVVWDSLIISFKWYMQEHRTISYEDFSAKKIINKRLFNKNLWRMISSMSGVEKRSGTHTLL